MWKWNFFYGQKDENIDTDYEPNWVSITWYTAFIHLDWYILWKNDIFERWKVILCLDTETRLGIQSDRIFW